MKGFWTRDPDAFDVERQLRAGRPKPRPELVASITARVRSRPVTHVGRLRVGVAVALTGLLVSSVAVVGAIGYAKPGLKQAVKEVKRAAKAPKKKSKAQRRHLTAATKQYVCHRTGSATNRYVLIEVPTNSAHFDPTKHPGDFVPPTRQCPP